MPLFDLECQACQHRWEDMVKNNVIPPCPACSATTVEKILNTQIAKPKFIPTPGTTLKLQTERTPKGLKYHGFKEEKTKKR
jgi:putative FmdB family regulatory protein